MGKYYVRMKVEFSGTIEAKSEADAERKAWDLWGADSDSEISYDGVYSIDAEDVTCEGCGEAEEDCECEEEEDEETEGEE